MSANIPCRCDERNKPLEDRLWAVLDRRCNYSAFNGYRCTPSAYSAVICLVCNGAWRTKVEYVNDLPDHPKD